MWIKSTLEPGLYMVSTPIGAARDITLRALDVLANCDLLVAEDTRVLRRLLDIHGIALNGRRLISYHDHSGSKVRQSVLETIQSGQSVSYSSDAGTPLVADPGFELIQDVQAAGARVIPVPGASAPLAALTVSGFPPDKFYFIGFLPQGATARRKTLEAFRFLQATLILFESPKRLNSLLTLCGDVFGDARRLAVARELTKKFEECRVGTPSELLTHYQASPARGECVVLIDRSTDTEGASMPLEDMLRRALEDASVKEAATMVAEATGRPRREVYQAALALKG